MKDVATLFVPVRGGDGTSDTQFTTIVNTFAFVPEPSSFVLGAIAAIVGAVVERCARSRVAAGVAP